MATRFSLHEFKSRVVVEFNSSEGDAFARCIELHRASGQRLSYFYKKVPS